MRTSLQLFCMFALFGAIVSAQTSLNFAFKDTTFYVPPKAVLNASSVPNGGVLSSSTVLLPGPISGTNILLSVYEENGKFAFFRQQLSVFNGQVMRSFDPIVTSMPLNEVKYTATLDGYLAFCSVEPDTENFLQVFIYKMLLNGTRIERIVITDNKDRNNAYRTLSLFNDNKNIAVAFVEGVMDIDNIFQPSRILMNKVNLLTNSLGYEFPIGSGGADFASCDSIPYTSTAYCIFKQDGSTRGAVISLTNSFSQDPVNLWSDSDTITYSPVYTAAVNGYYVVFASAKSINQVSLVASIVATSIGPKTINRWIISNDFVSFSINSVIPYYNGFAIFYTVVDAANNQFWYYQAFSQSFDVAISSTLIATVPSSYLLSSFSVAPAAIGGTPSDPYFDDDYVPINTDFGTPIGLLAIQSTGTNTVSAWYGQILKQTFSNSITLSGSIISPLLMIASFILGLILIF